MPDGLGGTVNTPLGNVKKEYLFIGAGALLIVGVAYYRSKKTAQAAATAAAGANNGIDPATGYPYGSAEDSAALANQGSYINPNQPYAPTGGGTSAGTPGTFTSNAQWAQFVEQYMSSNGSVQDAGPLSAAIGKYLTNQPVTDEQKSLISQAIAIGGYPPVSGPSGYPPSINTAPAGTTTPPAPGGGTPQQLPAPTGLWGGSGMFNRVGGKLVNNYIDTGWNPVAGAVKYRYEEHSAFGGQRFDTVEPRVHETVAMPNADHYVTVRAVDKDNNEGLPATIVVHTHDNSF
jgi:hypothetical protein